MKKSFIYFLLFRFRASRLENWIRTIRTFELKHSASFKWPINLPSASNQLKSSNRFSFVMLSISSRLNFEFKLDHSTHSVCTCYISFQLWFFSLSTFFFVVCYNFHHLSWARAWGWRSHKNTRNLFSHLSSFHFMLLFPTYFIYSNYFIMRARHQLCILQREIRPEIGNLFWCFNQLMFLW